MLAQVFTAFKYLESNIGLLLLSFFIQVSFYSIGGYYLISVFGIETLQSHTPLIFATLAVSLSIRINIVYLKEMLLGDIKFNGRLNLIKFGGLRHLFYVGRTTKQRFFCFMLFGSILSLFEISNWDLSFLMLDFLKVEKTEIFYLRWVVLLLTLNGIVTTAGKLISLIEDVKNSSFFSHAFFAVCTGSIATLFFAESELFKVTLVLLITYTTIIVSFIHDQIRREKSNISLLLA